MASFSLAGSMPANNGLPEQLSPGARSDITIDQIEFQACGRRRRRGHASVFAAAEGRIEVSEPRHDATGAPVQPAEAFGKSIHGDRGVRDILIAIAMKQ